LMPLSSVTVVLFAIGATRWMAGCSFKDEDGRPEKAGTSPRTRVSLLTPDPTVIAP
jgi:hypothetical protein